MNVVIIGGIHHNTLGVIRSVGEKIPPSSIDVIAVGKHAKKNILSQSRYVDSKRVRYADCEKDIISLLKTSASNSTKSIIICCSDGSSAEIISHKDELKDFYFIPNTVVDILNLMSKEVQTEYAIKSGLNVPESIIVRKGEKTNWNYFPCIIKPLKSIIGAGKADIHVVKDPEELSHVLDTIQADMIQIQKYINKKMEFQLIGCSLNGGEKIIIPGFTDIIRQPDNTNTGYLKYSPIAGLTYNQEGVERFVRTIGYSGLFSIEFIRDNDGNDYFLEINMRNDGNAYCVKSAGVNLPYIWCYYMENGKLPENEPVSFVKPVMFIPDFNDFTRGIKSVGVFGWIKQFFQAESHSIWNKNDMKPFWTQFGLYAKKALHLS